MIKWRVYSSYHQSPWEEFFPGFGLLREMAAHFNRGAHLTFFSNLILTAQFLNILECGRSKALLLNLQKQWWNVLKPIVCFNAKDGLRDAGVTELFAIMENIWNNSYSLARHYGILCMYLLYVHPDAYNFSLPLFFISVYIHIHWELVKKSLLVCEHVNRGWLILMKSQ